MFFDKKKKKEIKCDGCGSNANEKYSFCPHCGNSFLDPEIEKNNFGLLGRTDSPNFQDQDPMTGGLGITDKLVGSLFNSVMKSLDKQLKNQMKDIEQDMQNAEIKTFPNGIRISVANPNQMQQKKPKKKQAQQITEDQIKKISSLPKTKAKSNMKRFGDKVVYELSTPGLESVQDVFVSKLENGYEIKAIGSKKVYVNNIPINLPLRKYSIIKNKLLMEFIQDNDPAGI